MITSFMMYKMIWRDLASILGSGFPPEQHRTAEKRADANMGALEDRLAALEEESTAG